MPDTMLFAWMGDDVETILLVLAVMVAFVAIVVVLDLKQRGFRREFRRSSAAAATIRADQPESAHWHLKKSPAECGAGVKGGEGWPIPPLFGQFSFETNVFGYTSFGSASSFSPADERGRCVPAMFGVGVAPDEEPRSGSSSSAHESTRGRGEAARHLPNENPALTGGRAWSREPS